MLMLAPVPVVFWGKEINKTPFRMSVKRIRRTKNNSLKMTVSHYLSPSRSGLPVAMSEYTL